MENIRVGIIEDDKTIRESLIQSIAMYPAMQLSFAAPSIEDSLIIFDSYDFQGVDIIILDIGLPGMDGIQGIRPIKQKLTEVDIIVLTTYDETEKIFEALCSGACSYISKKTPLKQIMDSIFIVFRGGSFMSPSIARKIVTQLQPSMPPKLINKLTERQFEILQSLSEGLSYKLIAAKFEISIDTVRTHIKNIYKILEVNNKIEAVRALNRLS